MQVRITSILGPRLFRPNYSTFGHHLTALSVNITKAVTFAHKAIGGPTQWLTGYYKSLIQREELLGYWDNETFIATDECRLFRCLPI